MNAQETIFDIMFHGCQDLTLAQAGLIYQSIKNGKVRGVVLVEEDVEDTSYQQLNVNNI